MSAFMWPSDPDGKRWTSQRLRTVLQRESRIGMGVSLGIQSYRDIAIGISRKYMREGLSFHADTENEETAEDGFNDIADVHAGHGSHVAGMIYGRVIMEADGEVASMRLWLRQSSEEWHRFLGFASVMTTHESSKQETTRRTVWEGENQEIRMHRWKRLRGVDIQQQLE